MYKERLVGDLINCKMNEEVTDELFCKHETCISLKWLTLVFTFIVGTYRILIG